MNDTERLIARLLARIDELELLVQKQAAIIELQAQKINELEKRLNKNSRNS
jgi:hypothetical protein